MAEGEWVKLVSPIGSKSAVWESFGMPVYESNGVRRQDKEHVICKLCDAALKYTGNTTNMQKHIDRHHPVVSKNKKSVTSTSSGTIMSHMTKEKPTSGVSGQLHLTDFSKSQYSYNSPRALTITRKVGLFIAKDLRPLSIVDNEYFRDLLQELDPRYILPKRKHFAEKVIPFCAVLGINLFIFTTNLLYIKVS